MENGYRTLTKTIVSAWGLSPIWNTLKEIRDCPAGTQSGGKFLVPTACLTTQPLPYLFSDNQISLDSQIQLIPVRQVIGSQVKLGHMCQVNGSRIMVIKVETKKSGGTRDDKFRSPLVLPTRIKARLLFHSKNNPRQAARKFFCIFFKDCGFHHLQP